MKQSVYDSKLYNNHLYTWGYEGSKIEDLLQICQEYKIGLVIDVRMKRKTKFWDFDENHLFGQALFLAKRLEQISVSYKYLQELGNTTGTVIQIKLLNEKQGLNLLESLIVTQKLDLEKPNVLLLCTEKDYTTCHRLYVTERIQELLPGLWVQHL